MGGKRACPSIGSFSVAQGRGPSQGFSRCRQLYTDAWLSYSWHSGDGWVWGELSWNLLLLALPAQVPPPPWLMQVLQQAKVWTHGFIVRPSFGVGESVSHLLPDVITPIFSLL